MSGGRGCAQQGADGGDGRKDRVADDGEEEQQVGKLQAAQLALERGADRHKCEHVERDVQDANVEHAGGQEAEQLQPLHHRRGVEADLRGAGSGLSEAAAWDQPRRGLSRPARQARRARRGAAACAGRPRRRSRVRRASLAPRAGLRWLVTRSMNAGMQ